jgi:hypothetical protein
MRQHGIAKFPDPGPNGELRLSVGPGTGIDPESPLFKAAQRACQSLQPTPPAGARKKAYDALLKFAQCMRQHGVAKFPDPQPDGSLRIKARRGDTSLDPNGPAFKRAQQACQHLMPGGGPGVGTHDGSGS